MKWKKVYTMYCIYQYAASFRLWFGTWAFILFNNDSSCNETKIPLSIHFETFCIRNSDQHLFYSHNKTKLLILWGLEIWTLQSKLDFCHNYFELPHDIPTRLSVSSSIRNYKSVDIVNYCLDCCIVAHCKNVFNLWKPCIIWNNP